MFVLEKKVSVQHDEISCLKVSCVGYRKIDRKSPKLFNHNPRKMNINGKRSFRSLEHWKRHVKGNKMFLSFSNRIILCEVGGIIYNDLVLNNTTKKYIFLNTLSLKFICELWDIFHIKDIKDLLLMSNWLTIEKGK